MIKLFISQPMNGKTPEQIMNERIIAIESAKRNFNDEQVEVIDSYFEDYPSCDVKNEGLWYLGKSLMLLANADVAYFAKGWQEARGCRIENECAIAYGINVIEDYRK